MIRVAIGVFAVLSMSAGIVAAQTCPGNFTNDSGFIGAGENAPFLPVFPRTNAAVRWDPDGPGPLPEWLVVGGNFGSMDGTPARGVAAWDGQRWHPLGIGLSAGNNELDGVVALIVHDGLLHAAGRFSVNNDSQGVFQVARFNGTSWSTLGPVFSNAQVLTSLASHDGFLYVGGDFTIPAQQGGDLARWTGTQWQTLGNTMQGPGWDASRIETMRVYNGSLVVAGSFPWRVARLDAGAFFPFPAPVPCQFGCSGGVSAMHVEGNDLYIAGDFRLQNNQQPGVMRFDGTAWQSFPLTGQPSARSITRYNGFLYLCTGSSNQSSSILRLSGGQWLSVGPQRWYGPAVNIIRTLAEYNGRLILGGNFGPADLNNQQNFRYVRAIAQFDATDVLPLSRGVNARVTAMIPWHNNSALGVGRFPSAGAQPAAFIGVREPDGLWSPFEPGLDAQAWAVTPYQGGFVVGGPFTLAGTLDANKVAYWDGEGWNALGDGLDLPPTWLGVVNNELWAGVAPNLNNLPFAALFAWNGSSWRELPLPDGAARITILDGTAFTSGFDALGVQRIFRWNADAWHPLPLPRLAPRLFILGRFQGSLYAQGGNLIFRWTGDDWTLVASRPTYTFGSLAPVDVEDDRFMYLASDAVGGQFQQVYSWDGWAWAAHGLMPLNPRATWGIQTISARPPTLLALPQGVLVGGAFLYTDQQHARPQAYIARLDPTQRLRTLSAPEPIQFRDQGESITLDWQFEGTPQNLLWFRNNVALSDGPLDGVGLIAGATTRTLSITGLGADASGFYHCNASTPCLVVELAPITLVVPGACDTDYNGDGVTDQMDLRALEQIVAGADNPIGLDPDFNRDGNVDALDLDALAQVIAGGPCP